MKQYVIEDAYTGNSGIRCYKDGIEENYEIISDYNVSGYCTALENLGYARAYDVEKYKKDLEVAEEDLKWAKECLERAMKSPLIKH